MPTLLVAETKGKQRRLLTLIFPRQTDPQATESDRWDWSELRVGSSTIQGFGLFPRANSSFNWEKLDRPAVMPYLGKETEVESHTQARVLRSVLCGNFDVVLRKELFKSEGHEWVQDGLYVVQMARSEIAVLDPPLPVISDGDTQLLQVVVEPDFGSRGVFSIDQGDEMVCYMLAEEARRLLHLPPHIFALLLRHSDDEHADRNMATHLVQFTRRQQVHVLVSAHPIFRHSAFIMGNSNEPPRGPPNLELQEMQIIPCTDDDPLLTRAGLKQDPEALEKFHIFANQHPEARHSGVPFKYHVPPDTWADGVWTDWADWPSRCPGWYNVNQQPVNRPAFRRTKTGKIEVVPDLSGIVKARKLGLDGSQAERRLAKLGGLLWNSSLPDQTRKIFVLPMPVHMTRMLENVEKHSVGMEEFPHDIWSLALAFHRNSARDRGLGEENSTITMLGQMGIISTQQQNFTFPKELQLDEEEKEWLRRQVAAEELPKKLRV
ncbi:hypothetical protein AB1Y20_003769 [Prymnesium parvum]|uniref:Uncharacterized protein n=1 Tax=Prymnesium parvum TaxID=97485 RepID=A0AB34J7Z1_PRYPA